MGNCLTKNKPKLMNREMSNQEFLSVSNLYLLFTSQKVEKIILLRNFYLTVKSEMSFNDTEKMDKLIEKFIKVGEILQKFGYDLELKKRRVQSNFWFFVNFHQKNCLKFIGRCRKKKINLNQELLEKCLKDYKKTEAIKMYNKLYPKIKYKLSEFQVKSNSPFQEN